MDGQTPQRWMDRQTDFYIRKAYFSIWLRWAKLYLPFTVNLASLVLCFTFIEYLPPSFISVLGIDSSWILPCIFRIISVEGSISTSSLYQVTAVSSLIISQDKQAISPSTQQTSRSGFFIKAEEYKYKQFQSSLKQELTFRMVVGLKMYIYLCNQYLSPLKLWVLIPFLARCTRTTLCDSLWLAIGQWFSPGTCTPVSSINTTDRHDITEILLNVALNTITLTQSPSKSSWDDNIPVNRHRKLYSI